MKPKDEMGPAAGWRRPRPSLLHTQEVHMLWTIAVVLVILWLLGLVTSFTVHGFIHILLVIAIIAVLVRLIQGRRVV
jgi:hypothetical protein